MRISDWSSDVCSSDLRHDELSAYDVALGDHGALDHPGSDQFVTGQAGDEEPAPDLIPGLGAPLAERGCPVEAFADGCPATQARQAGLDRSRVPRVRLRPVLSQYVGQVRAEERRVGNK